MDNATGQERATVAAVRIQKLNRLADLLRAAVARVELANSEGNPILSAWLPDAKSTLESWETDISWCRRCSDYLNR